VPETWYDAIGFSPVGRFMVQTNREKKNEIKNMIRTIEIAGIPAIFSPNFPLEFR
jgi:pullulanase/glycogen debranching enzyme